MDRPRWRTPPRLQILELEQGRPFVEVLVEAYRDLGSLELAAKRLKISRQTIHHWLMCYTPAISNETLRQWASNGN